jgi:DGQHR domain-containing protein
MDKFKYIQIEQPIGTMFMGAMKARDVYDISQSFIRNPKNNNGIQREINETRVRGIAEYCEDPDAIFPTPIILSGKSECVKFDYEKNEIIFNENVIKTGNLFSVVDGQHRLEGIKRSKKEDYFKLPVIIIFDTNNEQDAYLFSVINGNQKPVSKSLVYDLFDLSSDRSVEKSCNYIVRSLNSTKDSPLYKSIKMLGVKSSDAPNAKVSQATIIRNLIPFISKDSSKDNLALKIGTALEKLDSNKFIFRELFIKVEESTIYQILFNYFKAFNLVIDQKFNDQTKDFFEKTIGMTSKIFTLRPIYIKARNLNNFKTSFFVTEIKEIFNEYSKNFGNTITSNNYGSSDSDAKKLYYRLIRCWCLNDIENMLYCNLIELRNSFFWKELDSYLEKLEDLYLNSQLKGKFSKTEFEDFKNNLNIFLEKQKQK